MNGMSMYAVVCITDDVVTCAPRLYKTKGHAYRRGIDAFLTGCDEVVVVDVFWCDPEEIFFSIDELARKIFKRK